MCMNRIVCVCKYARLKFAKTRYHRDMHVDVVSVVVVVVVVVDVKKSTHHHCSFITTKIVLFVVVTCSRFPVVVVVVLLREERRRLGSMLSLQERLQLFMPDRAKTTTTILHIYIRMKLWFAPFCTLSSSPSISQEMHLHLRLTLKSEDNDLFPISTRTTTTPAEMFSHRLNGGNGGAGGSRKGKAQLRLWIAFRLMTPDNE